MFYLVVGHAALHYASKTPNFGQEQMVQLVSCPTGFESPEFLFVFLLLFPCILQLISTN